MPRSLGSPGLLAQPCWGDGALARRGPRHTSPGTPYLNACTRTEDTAGLAGWGGERDNARPTMTRGSAHSWRAWVSGSAAWSFPPLPREHLLCSASEAHSKHRMLGLGTRSLGQRQSAGKGWSRERGWLESVILERTAVAGSPGKQSDSWGKADAKRPLGLKVLPVQ